MSALEPVPHLGSGSLREADGVPDAGQPVGHQGEGTHEEDQDRGAVLGIPDNDHDDEMMMMIMMMTNLSILRATLTSRSKRAVFSSPMSVVVCKVRALARVTSRAGGES